MLPWVLAVKDGGGRPVIYVKEGTSRNSDFAMDRDEGFKGKMERFWEGIGVNVTEVLGWSVDEIDGVDAVTAIQTLADASGMSKDPISRFNFMLSRYTWRDGIRSLDGLSYVRPAHLIHSSTVTYRFRSPLNVFKEVTVPFASILEGAGVHRILGKGSVAYYNTFCGAREDTFVRRDGGGTRNESVGRMRIGVDDEEIEAAMETYEPMRNFEETRKGDAVFPVKQLQAISTIIRDDEYTPISTYPNGATFKLNENTGVWMFSAITPYSKRPNQTRLETHVNLLSDVMASLLELQRLNVTRLIIDVSNNEGGIVCLGMAIAQQTKNEDSGAKTFQLRACSSNPLPPSTTPSAPSLLSVFSPTAPKTLCLHSSTRKLRNGRDERVVSSEEIFSPGTRRWVGGVAEDLTNRFHLNCTGYKAVARTGRWWKMLERSFEGVAVVSNGLCGSTCGTFVRALQHFHKVRTYTYSPITPYPYQPTSYEGGTVVSLSDLHTSIQTDNLTSITGSTLFRPFPFATNGKIPFYQLEQPGRSEPAEWVPIRADAHVGRDRGGEGVEGCCKERGVDVMVSGSGLPSKVWRSVAKREGWM
ncbi:hypothetical protein BC829DRAFT_447069 [Chytridium lagenaria]|nr:hypothetical protein BC829DRAFT_447069 [Chytridium lagenaria]